jgi:PAS domain S-box-containing protein
MNMSFAQQTGAESPGKGRRQQPTIKGLSFLEPFGFALAGCSGGLVLIWLANEPISPLVGVAAVFVVVMSLGGIWFARARTKRSDGCKAEQALRIVESMPVFAWSANPNGRFVYMNRGIRAFTGLPAKDLAPLGSDEFGLRHVAHPDRFESDGRMADWYGTTIDVDEEKKAEAELREREQQLSRLVDSVPCLIWCLAPDGEPTYFNKRLVDYTGLPIEQLDPRGSGRLSAAVKAIIHPDDATTVMNTVRRSIMTGEPFSLKHRLRRSDGVHRWVEARAEPMRNTEGVIVLWYGVCLDIEDQVQAQEELRRTQETLARASQAASLAELSASIAHEVNQPLAAIVANSHACQRWLTADPPNIERARSTVGRIIRDSNATADVISRIRALFKQSTAARRRATLDVVVAEVQGCMAESARQNYVSIETEIEADLPPVVFDRVQIQQVLVNLIRNAIEAMEPIESAKSLGIRVRRCGDVVQVEIRDHGPGVDYPDRIFEPFVTTKKNGMGMGLAICRSIIESHGGRLWVEGNQPGETTFTFALPVAAKYAE